MAQQNDQMMHGMPMPENGGMGMNTHDETWKTMPPDVRPMPGDGRGGGGAMMPYYWSAGGGMPGSGMPGGQDGGMWNSANQGMVPTGISSAHAQSQRMMNPVDMESTHTPADSSEAYQASLRSLLARNVGYYIVCTFLVGTQQHVTWEGILHTVGSDYLVLYQPDFERYISCDLYALKFAQFHNSRTTPYCNGAQAMQGRLGW